MLLATTKGVRTSYIFPLSLIAKKIQSVMIKFRDKEIKEPTE